MIGSGRTPVVFTDLDDSLFQTRPKCPVDVPLETAAVDRDGNPLSFTTPEQRQLLDWMAQGTVIPVTGRNSDALSRVRLAFTSYRITSHGALLVDPDGRADPEWLACIHDRYQPWLDRLTESERWLNDIIATERLDARCRIIEDQGLPVYVSLKGSDATVAALAERVRTHWHGEGAMIHVNGHNMALLPAYASKAEAVGWVMERVNRELDNPLFIGIGDSESDLPFLRLCHYAMIPQRSQIRHQVWT